MPTRTKNAHFKHPSVVDGTVHFENESYPVTGGIVECPIEIGDGAEWARASAEDVAKAGSVKKVAETPPKK